LILNANVEAQASARAVVSRRLARGDGPEQLEAPRELAHAQK
jgi:hypothetical protein